ncbi:sigma-54 dependent transcriptional regulator [uncultured Desulfobacter sp.]|uniref:sigma-54 interaction domain-containing protein n=1 Tax=uncultured Desulfobacter sp. TaxID=240139 RepID=UPI002AABEBFF|nr:sigma-54 dependent transcriptional regulator [uncultured Desulfobacter sp.]
MNRTINENDFFKNATLTLCSTLDIERALHQCLIYVRQFMPAREMGFHVYHRSSGIVETVALADPECGRAVSIKTQLSAQGRKRIENRELARVRYIDHLGHDPVTGPVARRLNAVDVSAVIIDLVLERTMLGIFSVFSESRQKFTQDHMDLLRHLDKPCAVALTNSLRFRELNDLKEMLADDSRYFQKELNRMAGETVVGAENGLGEVMNMVRQVSPLESPVLLLGETGTGKEVIANAIHNLSLRNQGPFIRVNCGAIPPSLLDSELFGYEKGAFTGAVTGKRGRIERARGGTLFLDEIGELSMEAQIRLLRVLQEKEIDRVGGTETIKVNIRVIAATHRDLEQMMAQNRFRPDLFFRLQVFPIPIPPLRNRTGDIPSLTTHFIIKKAREMKLSEIPVVPDHVMARLMAYQWPGNVRELENAVERSMILDRDGSLFFKEIVCRPVSRQADLHDRKDEILSLDHMTANYILKTLSLCKGRIEGEKGAAGLLGIHPSTLRKRMKKLNVPFGRGVDY